MKKLKYDAILRNANLRNPGNKFVASCAMLAVKEKKE